MIAIGVGKYPIENPEGFLSQVFGGGYANEQDGFVTGQCSQKIGDQCVLTPTQKSVIPDIDHMLLGERFYFREIHDHAIVGTSLLADDVTAQGDFEHIPVTMQMPALRGVVGDAMAGVKLETTRDEHEQTVRLGSPGL